MKFTKQIKIVAPMMAILLLAPVAIMSGPTQDRPIDDHPWGGEQPPTILQPDRSAIRVGTPLIIYDAALVVMELYFSPQPEAEEEPMKTTATLKKSRILKRKLTR
jgi:hypothetical protein